MGKERPKQAPEEHAYTGIGAHKAVTAVANELEALRRQVVGLENRVELLEKKRK